MGAVKENLELFSWRAATMLRARRRLGYIGWAGHGNVGDDAMFDALQVLAPGAEPVIFQTTNRERRLLRAGLSGRRFFGAVALGGGTLINEGYLELAAAAVEMGVPVFTLGTGVGSCGYAMEPKVAIDGWPELLRRFAGVGVRGPLSKRALEQAGFEGAEVIGDLALSLTREKLVEPSDPPRIALNIALPEPGSMASAPYNRLEELLPVIRRLVSQGWEVVPIALHEIDIEPTAALLKMAVDRADKVNLPASAEELFDLLAPCTCTIGVRLHAAVLSCCVGVPPLMIAYRDKGIDFMESMDLRDWCIDLSCAGAGEIAERATTLAAMASPLRARILERALGYKRTQASYIRRLAPRLFA